MARRTVRTLMVAAIFATGFLCGTLMQRPAEAQLGDALKGAAGSGGLGSAGELGTSILDMQKHVDGLNKNLETLRKIKTALGG